MICQICYLSIIAPHGNSRYCKACADSINNMNSKLSYGKRSIMANRYWLSNRTLKNAWDFTDPEKVHELEVLVDDGLDIKNYKSKITIKNETVYTYGNFGFYYLTDKNIIICKL